jgi:hypothetical protein
MKRAVIFISFLSLCLSGCNKEQQPTIYGQWLRTWTTQYTGPGVVVWIEEPQGYPFILDFKANNSYYIYEDMMMYQPEGYFHLDIRKRALVFEEYSRILPYYWDNDYEIQIVEITSDFLWLKNNAGFEAKFKRYFL